MLSAPDVFSLIDSSADGELDEAEVRAHFHRLGKAVPETWAIEDTDRNGRISWEEFHGPKGVRPQTSPGVVQQ
jgi:Ca2+-binding EF-hand superfamily protein